MNVYSLVLPVVLLLTACLAWGRVSRSVAVGVSTLAVLWVVSLLSMLAWPVAVLAFVVAGLLGWHRWSRSSALVARWSARARRKAGVASSVDIARRAGAVAMRRMGGKVRPSLSGLPRHRLWRVPLREVAVELVRVGVQRVWASVEDVVLIFGGPRTGKTGWLAGRVIDAAGAAVVTSTRTDLLELCAPLREKRGPVHVFNAVGLGGRSTTLAFDPLVGCADPVTAVERATDMIAATSRGSSSGDAERWDAQARRVLAALLHAAALAQTTSAHVDGAGAGRGSMWQVLGWVADNDRAAHEVPALLRRSQVQAFEKDAQQFIDTNDRTRTSITNSIMPALGWLNHPAAADAARPGATFDVAELLESRATVFLLGAEEANTGPLVCALTGHIAREARRLAKGGRLDPPLTLALDEAALISPVPLENWSADMGGRGVTIIAAFQSRAQLLDRYGAHKTATILNNTASVLLFGGTRDRDDLQFWSTLAGERDEKIVTTDMNGRVASRSVRQVPVFSASRIANLPPARALVFRRGIDPVVGRAAMAWRRRDVRAHQAGFPAAASAPGWPGRAAFTRALTARTLTTLRAAWAVKRDQLAARCDVMRKRVRFWWRRTRLGSRIASRTGSSADSPVGQGQQPGEQPEQEPGTAGYGGHSRPGRDPKHWPDAAQPIRVISQRVDRQPEPSVLTPEAPDHAAADHARAGRAADEGWQR